MCDPSSLVTQISDQLELAPQLQSQYEMPLQSSNVYDVVDATKPRTKKQEKQKSDEMSRCVSTTPMGCRPGRRWYC